MYKDYGEDDDMKAIDHLNRYVSNVERFIEFYSEVLEYELIDKGIKGNGKSYAILRGEGHELFISEKDNFLEETGENFRHIGYSIEDVDRLLQVLKSKGYVEEDQELIIKQFSRQFYIKDPDGFEIDLIQWTDKELFYKSLEAKNNNYIFESSRLGFRTWKESDRELFSRMNSGENVMRYFPKTLSREESDNFFNRIEGHFKENGYGLWAVEIKDTKEFIGFIGFLNAVFEAEFTPCVEIGWRLDNRYWNKGYATEGAKECLEYGFSNLNFSKIYSFTAKINNPSENVMKKIGMEKVGEFQHPKVEEGSSLKTHVLYKIDKKMHENIME